MKNKIILFAILLSQLALGAGKQIRVGVNGMVCAFCAQGITKKFKQESAVESVDVRLGDKLVTLTTKENQDIPDDKIRQILTDAGYNVSRIERK